ncbi:hypothetical protein DFW101_3520 [Solidesulfovibrio carbinoliphilus subsp. oakridgensis]|uniref:Uncharacterized protein n=1 Tax=Solidesulfovibrio carbinoliphilus subsp. oakridgensis TaxID=694327 RepID=G7QC70_9BACT|nr:hypothetical protein [Solidesulfovibrio carbinoliphilus]EHJ49516.1 hypothetical protein DFW101_3520 [Solidesulfovibrio carbinoliphilus subsp. oakridgensis]
MAGKTGPTKEDARTFLKRLQQVMAGRTLDNWISVRDIVREMGECHNIPEKRCLFLLEKWAGCGWYEYGVSLDLGWLTEEGMALEVN